MAASPSQRTLDYLRRSGWPNVQVVERWIPQARRRKDLFKFADILAVHPKWGHLYVQATTGSHVNERLLKMREFAAEQIEDVVKAGARVEIYGWRTLKGKGRRKWHPIIMNVGMNEVYNMTNEQWEFIWKILQEVCSGTMILEAVEGDLKASTRLSNYPPSIDINVSCLSGDRYETPGFTTGEIAKASQLVADMSAEAIAKWPFLRLRRGPSFSKYTLTYRMRPERYDKVPGVESV